MPKFFLPDNQSYAVGDFLYIEGRDAFHISHTLRMKKGETLVLTSTNRMEYTAEINSFDRDSVKLEVLSVCENKTEPRVFSSLFQALVKGDKMDTVIQKAVELGVGEIYPVSSSRCIVHADEKRGEKKLERWQRIAEEAAKQCGRGIVPRVHPIISYKEALVQMKKSNLYFLCYETSVDNTPKKLFKDKHFESVSFFIGPEGGISPEEIELAHSEGIPDVTLGKLILRTETASGAVLSMILYETEF